ncbi:MAG: amidohydrolase family protein, partial [Acidobacteriota bacterium]
MLDTLIRGATVFDGVDTEPQRLAVGVRGETIAHVGDDPGRSAARRVVDAEGLFLCPGFIDTHASTGLGYMLPNAADNKLFQGVTTEIIGNCGTSTGPVGRRLVPTMEKLAEEIGFTFNWLSLGDWFEGLEDYGLPFNIGTFIGHSTLRAGICADAQQVTRREIDQMVAMLDEATAEGALGLSTGLVYAPGSFAETEEIIELAKVASRHGGIYVSHIRDERQDLEASIEETVRIGREAELPILVSHLKAAEKPNWGKIPGVIARIEAARQEGLEINFEVYPYAAVSTKLRTFIPKPTLADGVEAMVEKLRGDEWRRRSTEWLVQRGTDFQAMVLITESVPGAQGRSVAEIAADRGTEPAEMVVDLLLADPDAWIVYHCIAEADMDAAILWPDSIVCSDSWSHPINAPNQFGNPHPRTFGAFTRFLERYALSEERLPFGHAIRKITSYPAHWLRLPQRGRIAEGCFADLVLLDPSRVKEKATFADPRQTSEGTERVWVNGTLMLEGGEVVRKMPGHIL